MSPRRNRRDADVPELHEDRLRRGIESVQVYADGDWLVRTIPGGAATKTYRCPGCDQEIPAGVPHVVVWPVDGQGDRDLGAAGGRITDRRHWHRACWQARDRRSPTRRRA